MKTQTLPGCSHPDEMDNLLWRRDDRRWLGGCWRCRTCERTRAQARRAMYGGSYWKYEHSLTRALQRGFYPLVGAGGHRMTKAERSAILDARYVAEWSVIQETLQARAATRRGRQ